MHLIEAGGPYISLDDGYRVDDGREALRSGDLRRASQLASGADKLTAVTA